MSRLTPRQTWEAYCEEVEREDRRADSALRQHLEREKSAPLHLRFLIGAVLVAVSLGGLLYLISGLWHRAGTFY